MKKYLLIYSTKYGSVLEISNLIKQELFYKNIDIEMINVKLLKETINFDNYEKIILGGSIYVGKLQKEILDFINKYQENLLKKPLALFVAAGEENEEKQKWQLEKAFPAEIVRHSFLQSTLGYAVYLEKMSFIERLVVRFLKKAKKSFSAFKENKIKSFCEKLIQ